MSRIFRIRGFQRNAKSKKVFITKKYSGMVHNLFRGVTMMISRGGGGA